MREIGRFAYLWAWPLVNVFNRYTSLKRWSADLLGGIAPIAPINHLCMLNGYIDPRQRYVTCPCQDLIYGFGILDFGREPVVVQVPDFGERFWVFQATDLRTDGFADLGAMYGTKPGFYLLAGPDWPGSARWHRRHVPRRTNIGTIIPRMFQGDDGRQWCDPAAAPAVMAYPLSSSTAPRRPRTGRSLTIPWIKLGEDEWHWVEPGRFFDVLPQVLDACPPLPGEEALYALIRSVLDAAAPTAPYARR